MSDPKIYKIKHLAEKLECTRQTVHNMLREGRIPVPHIEGTKPKRWNSEAIDAWIASRKGVE